MDMYNQYREDCCICDSNNTVINIDCSQTSIEGVNFTFPFVYIHCNECGFEFGNRALTAINVSNRDAAKNRALSDIHALASLKIDILPVNYPNVELPVGMYTQKKVIHQQRDAKSFNKITRDIIIQEDALKTTENQGSFSEMVVKVVSNGFFKRGYAQ